VKWGKSEIEDEHHKCEEWTENWGEIPFKKWSDKWVVSLTDGS